MKKILILLLLYAAAVSAEAPSYWQPEMIRDYVHHLEWLARFKGLKQEVVSLGSRANKQKIKSLIKELCVCAPFQLGKLAQILERNPKYLRDNYLTDMVRSGELHYQYPDQPAHPHQAYITSKGGRR